MAGERRFTQPRDLRRQSTRVGGRNPFQEMTKDEELIRRRRVARATPFPERKDVATLPPRYREPAQEDLPPGTVGPGETADTTTPDDSTTTPEPPPYVPGLWMNYGQDWLSRLNILDPNEMALDPSRQLELYNALIGAQYGTENTMNDRFGGYLRSQGRNIADMMNLYDRLAVGGVLGGGAEARGGAYRTFEDMYESLTGAPGQAGNISGWRNLLYGGAGAAAPGGMLQQNILPTETMGQAGERLGELQSLLGATIGRGRFETLQNLMPMLWNRYNALPGSNATSVASTEPGGETTYTPGTRTPWLAWLQQGGYLPNMAY